MMTGNHKVIGIAWYRRDDYPMIREIMEDAHVLPETYAAWSRLANSMVLAERANGSRIIKAIVVPQDFIGWCVIRHQNANADARTLFVNEAVARALAKLASVPDSPPAERKRGKARRKGYARIPSCEPALAA